MNLKSCPDRMYPMDSDYPEECENFAELKASAESASDSLNFPIGWSIYDEADEDWGKWVEPGAIEEAYFELVFLLPRKYGKTWSLRTTVFDRAEVQAWLDAFVRAEVMRWYGWSDR